MISYGRRGRENRVNEVFKMVERTLQSVKLQTRVRKEDVFTD